MVMTGVTPNKQTVASTLTSSDITSLFFKAVSQKLGTPFSAIQQREISKAVYFKQ